MPRGRPNLVIGSRSQNERDGPFGTDVGMWKYSRLECVEEVVCQLRLATKTHRGAWMPLDDFASPLLHFPNHNCGHDEHPNSGPRPSWRGHRSSDAPAQRCCAHRNPGRENERSAKGAAKGATKEGHRPPGRNLAFGSPVVFPPLPCITKSRPEALLLAQIILHNTFAKHHQQTSFAGNHRLPHRLSSPILLSATILDTQFRPCLAEISNSLLQEARHRASRPQRHRIASTGINSVRTGTLDSSC